MSPLLERYGASGRIARPQPTPDLGDAVPADRLTRECVRCGHRFHTRGSAPYETTCRGCLFDRMEEGAFINPSRLGNVSYRFD